MVIETLSVDEYLDQTKSYLKDIKNDLKKSGAVKFY